MSELFGGQHVGPFTFYYSWIGTFLFVVVSIVVAKIYGKHHNLKDVEKFADLILMSVMIWIIIWKGSGMLPVAKDLFVAPVKVLFAAPASGADKAAVIAVILYTVLTVKRVKPVLAEWLDLCAVSITAGLIPFFLLHLELGQQIGWPWGILITGRRYTPVNFYEVFILLCSLVMSLYGAKAIHGLRGSYLLALVGVGSLFVSLFSESLTLWILLSPTQWGLLATGGFGLWGMKRFTTLT